MSLIVDGLGRITPRPEPPSTTRWLPDRDTHGMLPTGRIEFIGCSPEEVERRLSFLERELAALRDQLRRATRDPR